MNNRIARTSPSLARALRIAIFGTFCFVVVATFASLPAEYASIGPSDSFTQTQSSIIPDDWRMAHMRPGSPRYEAIFSEEARQRVLSMPPTPVVAFSAGRLPERLEQLTSGMLFVDGDRPLQPIDAIDWSIASEGSYYATQLHGLIGLGAVLRSRRPMPDDVALATARVILDWARRNPQPPGLHERAWFEGTVVKRLSNLIAALNAMRRHGDINGLSYEELLYLIIRDSEYLLLTDDIYHPGNHGIRQDLILASFALALPDDPLSDRALKVAESRLEDAARELFTEEGVWSEHAPGYVNYVIRLLLDVQEVAYFSDRFSPKPILKRIDDSLHFLLTILMPDLRIPWVGSSRNTGVSGPIRRFITDQEGRDAEEVIADHVAHRARSLHFFPGYGHAVVRGDPEEGLYLLFHAGQNLPAGKRHEDALSFILHHHGRLWITEGGHETYEQSEMTEHLRSPYAHNTYVFDNTVFRPEQAPEVPCGLLSATQSDSIIDMHGFSERYPAGARVDRRITVDLDNSLITISDELRRASRRSPGCFQGLMHFAPDLDVQIDRNRNLVSALDRSSGRILMLAFESDSPIDFSAARGERRPLRGWAFDGEEHGPTTALIYEVCRDATITIRLSWTTDPDHADGQAMN